jgi:hypothetical protein
MTGYRYAGPQPAEDADGELIHPGDVRELSEPPDCPPWERTEPEPDGSPPPSVTTTTTPATGTEGGM